VSAYWQPRTAALYLLLTFMFTLLALLNALWLAGTIGIGIMIFCSAVLLGRKQPAERK
jgi:putative membrane protein